MTEIPHSDFIRAEQQYRVGRYANEGGSVTGWGGWVAFAGVVMALAGGLYIVAGLVTLFQSGYYEVNTRVLAVDQSWTVLGWTQLVLGILMVVAGVALLRAKMWARIVAVVLAALTVVENFVEMAASPLWNLLLIALAVTVIYAIVAHGRDVEGV